MVGSHGLASFVRQPYDVMPLQEIEALPVRGTLMDDALVFLWTTQKFLRDAFGVLGRLGSDLLLHDDMAQDPGGQSRSMARSTITASSFSWGGLGNRNTWKKLCSLRRTPGKPTEE